MSFKYLNLEEVLRIHFQVIEDFGGSHGVRDDGRILSVLEAPKVTAFGIEQYKSVYEKAAVYLRNIIGDHPFVDGNKRTALTVCGIFLSRNNVKLISSQIELEKFVLNVAINHPKISDIAGWLESHSK